MAEQPVAISEIDDPSLIRMMLLASGKGVHAPLSVLDGFYQPLDADLTAIAALSTQTYGRSLLTLANSTALAGQLSAFYQPLDADLTSWAAVVRASGFDAFAAAPSSANLRTLLTDETGTGAAVFATSPALVTPILGVAAATSINFGGQALSAYNESLTFTPALLASGSTFSYATQSGVYNRTGNRIDYHIIITLNTSGNTLTGNTLTLTGLPAAAKAATSPQAILTWDKSTSSYVSMFARALGGTTTMDLFGITAAGTTQFAALLANQALHATNGTTLRATGFYFV